MQEHDGMAATDIDVTHFGVEHTNAMARLRIGRGSALCHRLAHAQ